MDQTETELKSMSKEELINLILLMHKINKETTKKLEALF